MKSRAFRGSEISEVMAQVRAEVGEHAVILDTKYLPGRQVEVVVASSEGPVIELRHELPRGRAHEIVDTVETVLTSQGVDPRLIDKVSHGMEAVAKKRVRSDIVVSNVLEQHLHFSAEIPLRARVVALVGATGAGKTTTIAKLAARIQRAFGLRIGLISIDTFRVGAGFQLQTYASLLTMPCEVIDPSKSMQSELQAALRRMRHLDLVFIDTPGCSPRDTERIHQLANLVGRSDEIETMLTLSAPSNEVDLYAAAQAFKPYNYSRTIFTKLDESGFIGPIVNTALKIGKPLAFFTTGQKVPADIEPASARRLGWMLMHTVH